MISSSGRIRRRPIPGGRALLAVVSGASIFALGACSSTPAAHPPAATPTSAATSSAAPGAQPGTGSAAPSGSAAPRSSAASKQDAIHQTVPARTLATAAPVPLSGQADFGNGVRAQVVSVTPTTATPHGVGEIGGPAVSLVLTLTNKSKTLIHLDSVTVTLTDAAGTPEPPLTNGPAAAFHGVLAPGNTARATYLFTLPTSHRNPVTISLSYSTDAPVVLFQGDAA